MTFPTDRDLHDLAGLDTDGITAFRATMAARGKAVEPPSHLVPPRRERWRAGAYLAQQFYGGRKGAGLSRRSRRNAEIAATGACTILIDAKGHRAERERIFRSLLKSRQP